VCRPAAQRRWPCPVRAVAVTLPFTTNAKGRMSSMDLWDTLCHFYHPGARGPLPSGMGVRQGSEGPLAARQAVCYRTRVRTGDEPVWGGRKASAPAHASACSRRSAGAPASGYNMRSQLDCLHVAGGFLPPGVPEDSGHVACCPDDRRREAPGYSHGECHFG
jgi:hypothetical protein